MSWSWSWNFLFGVAFEDGRWESGGISSREAAAWNSGAGTPDAIGISIALSLFSMSSFAFFGVLSNLNVAIELQDGLWRGFWNNWSLLFGVALEDGGWELGSINDSEAAAWDS